MKNSKKLEWPTLFSLDEIDDFHDSKLQVIDYNSHHRVETIDELLMELEFHFPHVATRLTFLAGTEEFDKEINDLVIDTTGKRKGFPPEVISILLKLSSAHEHKYGNSLKSNVWKDNQFK